MTEFKVAIALAVPAAFGYVLLSLLPDFRRPSWFKAILSFGFGYGASSYLFFVWLLAVGRATRSFTLLPAILAILLALALWGFARKGLAEAPDLAPKPGEDSFSRKLKIAFCLGLALSVTASFLHFLYNPQGDWDAWDLWNMRALFLSHAGFRWREFFLPELPRNMDYPLLLSSGIASAWKFLGTPHVWVPGMIALLFTYTSAGALVCLTRAIRGPSQSWIAGLVLVSTPFFAHHGASQYADATLGFYMLGAVAVWTWHDFELSPNPWKIVLAGLLAGMAAWTKNEGILFLPVVVAARVLSHARPGNFKALAKELLIWGLAVLPTLVALLYFRSEIAPPNDLFSKQSHEALWAKATDLGRHLVILKAWEGTLRSFGRWYFAFPLILTLYAFMMGLSPASRKLRQFPLLTLVFLMLGYYGTYLTSPYPVAWHLTVSLDRLLIHLWPTAVFAYFLSFRSPEERETLSIPLRDSGIPPLPASGDPGSSARPG